MVAVADFHILFAHIGIALAIVQRPHALPVENDRRFGSRHSAADLVDVLEDLAGLLHAAEDPGIRGSVVANHRAVEFFRRAPALAPLEILDRVAAVGHRLDGREGIQPRGLGLIVGLPVHQTGGALHQQERPVLQAAVQIMPEGGLLGNVSIVTIVPLGIGIPGGNVDSPGHLVIVQVVELKHHIDGHRQLGRKLPDGRGLVFNEGDRLLRHKPPPLKI